MAERTARDYSIRDIAALLRDRPADVCADLGFDPAGRKAHSWRVGSVWGDRGTKLVVTLGGPRKGTFAQFAGAGADMTGDMLKLLMLRAGKSKIDRDVVDHALDILGLDRRPDTASRRDVKRQAAARREKAGREAREWAEQAEERRRALADIWAASRRPPAREVDRVREYFAHRGLDADLIPASFGVAVRKYWIEPEAGGAGPRCLGSFLTILAPLFDSRLLARGRTRLVALHQTFLDPDGPAGIAPPHPDTGALLPKKKLAGAAAGGVVSLMTPALRLADTLAIAEGIEKALLIRQRRPGWAVWTPCSIGNLPSMTVPDTIGRLVIVEDGDSAPAKANGDILRHDDGSPVIPAVETVDGFVAPLAGRRQITGRRLEIVRTRAPDGCDLDDLLRGDAA